MCDLPMPSPTVVTTRFQPIIVPMPKDKAMATITHKGAYSTGKEKSLPTCCKYAFCSGELPGMAANFLAESSKHNKLVRKAQRWSVLKRLISWLPAISWRTF